MGLGFWVVGFWAWFSGFGLRCRARGVGCGFRALGTRDSLGFECFSFMVLEFEVCSLASSFRDRALFSSTATYVKALAGFQKWNSREGVVVLLEDYHRPLRICIARMDKD